MGGNKMKNYVIEDYNSSPVGLHIFNYVNSLIVDIFKFCGSNDDGYEHPDDNFGKEILNVNFKDIFNNSFNIIFYKYLNNDTYIWAKKNDKYYIIKKETFEIISNLIIDYYNLTHK